MTRFRPAISISAPAMAALTMSNRAVVAAAMASTVTVFVAAMPIVSMRIVMVAVMIQAAEYDKCRQRIYAVVRVVCTQRGREKRHRDKAADDDPAHPF